ncbi:MAG: hypothetical protein IPG45_23775 [Deltaproteobacteria bacterium]|jgi:hypothetical protein|nr:hypothetical protein [Deltaproteobacteria bacterium]
MGLSLERVRSTTPVSLQGPENPTVFQQRGEVGLGPRVGAPRRRPVTASGLFGFMKPLVAATLLGAAALIPHYAQAQTGRESPLVEDSAPLARGFEQLFAADQNGDGKLIGTRFGDELQSASPLAKAIFAYADYVNPNAPFSPWGQSARGDYVEGGITFKPRHMTANRILLKADLEAIWGPLATRLQQPLGAGLVAQDLKQILALDPKADAASVHQAAELLLAQIHTLLRAEGRNDTQPFTQAELLARLPANSLERLIAEQTAGHGVQFFASALNHNPALDRRAAAGDAEIVSSAQQQYLLTIAKRAKEAALLQDIQALLR